MFFKHTAPADAPLMAQAIVSTCRQNGWFDEIQPQFLNTIFHNLHADALFERRNAKVAYGKLTSINCAT